eukprot:CAMPEP_0184680200 /NCGR_PEP_ID=MMETSP0312-20130426/3077_1 /TAXON_ID=31354 /ORGANISM="Compsopogon coeruleus, Strain SAG 36.94" /LENGTH=561 /DNA_ID=CAMNT_0027130153 /DNA_START=83 /DNA_END=1769 /DNA_ORIENTATION=+
MMLDGISEMKSSVLVLVAIFLHHGILSSGLQVPTQPFVFVEVSTEAGIVPFSTDKTSGPSIADLDQDGYLDVVMCNHVRDPVEVYYGSPTGVFKRTFAFQDGADRHGTAVGDIDGNGKVDIVLATEKNSWGSPYPAEFALTSSNGSLENYDSLVAGVTGSIKSVAVRLVDLDKDGDLDIFLLGRPRSNPIQHGIFQNQGKGTFKLVRGTGIETALAQIGFLVTDFDGDGYQDIFIFSPGVSLYRGLPNLKFEDVTTKVLPRNYSGQFSGAVTFDMDNDGDFDVYLSGGSRLKGPLIQGNDILLENQNGVFVDISSTAKIPRRGGRVGITAADFNNDGFVDLFLPSIGFGAQRIPDIMLLNMGDKTFTGYTKHGANGPLAGDVTYPSGAQAFDYNKDGLVDVIVGTRYRDLNLPSLYEGTLRLFKNVLSTSNNYLIVNVPVSIGGETTMDALLNVSTPIGNFYRRVGSVGESRTQSFIDQVHFGIGSSSEVVSISLTLVSGRFFTSSGSIATNQAVDFPPFNENMTSTLPSRWFMKNEREMKELYFGSLDNSQCVEYFRDTL